MSWYRHFSSSKHCSVQFSSVAQSCPTLFDSMNCIPIDLVTRSTHYRTQRYHCSDPLYKESCLEPSTELSSGPARPLRAGSAASWKKLWICSQLCPGRNKGASFVKGTRTMVSLSSILGRSCDQIDTVRVGTYPIKMEWIECY